MGFLTGLDHGIRVFYTTPLLEIVLLDCIPGAVARFLLLQDRQAGDVQLHADPVVAGPLGDAALDAPQGVQVIGHHADAAASGQGVLPLLLQAWFGLLPVLHFFLGITSVDTWLWLADWNSNKRKSDPEAPTSVAAFLGVIFLFATISLTGVLEIVPHLSIYAPVLFPALAVVGAINLVLISQQEHREQSVKLERQARKAYRFHQSALQPYTDVQCDNQLTSTFAKVDGLVATNRARETAKYAKLDTIVDILTEHPDICIADLAQRIGRSRTTTYKYLEELEQTGRINRNGHQS